MINIIQLIGYSFASIALAIMTAIGVSNIINSFRNKKSKKDK